VFRIIRGNVRNTWAEWIQEKFKDKSYVINQEDKDDSGVWWRDGRKICDHNRPRDLTRKREEKRQFRQPFLYVISVTLNFHHVKPVIYYPKNFLSSPRSLKPLTYKRSFIQSLHIRLWSILMQISTYVVPTVHYLSPSNQMLNIFRATAMLLFHMLQEMALTKLHTFRRRGVKLTTVLHLAPKSRMRGAILPHPQYTFMACVQL
jgi:hypothetical protein